MSDQTPSVNNKKAPFLSSFLRSQMTSIIATSFDYVVFISCMYLLSIYYVTASAFGAVAGAIISFYLGRNWAFRMKDGSFSKQALKYICTSALSLALNVYGIYFITECFSIPEEISKIIISLLVGIFFNFFMYRYFVYK